MLRIILYLIVMVAMSGCVTKPEKSVDVAPDDLAGDFEHNSAISAESILISRQASQQYQRCLTEQIKKYVHIEMDVRESTGRILKGCDAEFNPIREAFKSDNIPANVTERYINTKRSRSTPNILRVLMFAQSRRNEATATATVKDGTRRDIH